MLSRWRSVCAFSLYVTSMATLGLGCGDGEPASNEGAGGSDASGGTGGSGGSGGGTSFGCETNAERCEDYGRDRPFRPSEHTAVYAPETGEMIVFGGSKSLPTAACGPGPTETTDETWIYGEACDAWREVTAEGPSARSRHAATYGAGKMWVFGGRTRAEDSTSGDYTLFDELWAFDPIDNDWLRLEQGEDWPLPRVNSAMAWDSRRQRVWMFSGNRSRSGFSYSFIEDLWSYDPRQNVWELERPDGQTPTPRIWHGLIYDEARDQLVVFGGMDAEGAPAEYLADLYALDLESMSWRVLHDGGAGAPDERFWGSLVYRPRARDYLLFGGHDATALGNRNDTLVYDPDLGRWETLHTGDSYNAPPNDVCDFPPDFANVDESQPERRHATSMVWSSACERSLLFGGKSDCGIIDDVWGFDDNAWVLLQPATEGEVCFRWQQDTSRCSSLCQ